MCEICKTYGLSPKSRFQGADAARLEILEKVAMAMKNPWLGSGSPAADMEKDHLDDVVAVVLGMKAMQDEHGEDEVFERDGFVDGDGGNG